MEQVVDPQENLNAHLISVHSIEEQALLQMAACPGIAGDPALTAEFRAHFDETIDHERRVRERLRERGGVLPAAGNGAGGEARAVAVFTAGRPESPVKLLALAYAYEHLEATAYELLRAAALRAGDPLTVELAEQIQAQEAGMSRRLEDHFNAAVAAMLASNGHDPGVQLDACLTDLHAIESQELELLETSPALVSDYRLETVYQHHLDETRTQGKRLEERLAARGGGPSHLKDATMRLRALRAGELFAARPDADPALAGFSLAFEHLEIAGYTMLAELAELAGDPDTAAAARASLAEERAEAQQLDRELERILVHG